MSRRWLLVLAIAAALLAVVAAAIVTTDRGGRPLLALGNDRARAPEGVRIRVEVLNATRVRGLARRATMHLRDRGFDVVEIGTSAEQRDSTIVLDRSGNPEWARVVAAALGMTTIETRIDSLRYLDVTVLLGADWTPPTDPFYP